MNKNYKRLFGTFMALTMSSCIIAPAAAASPLDYSANCVYSINTEEEINRALNGISDIPVGRLGNSFASFYIDENGNEVPIETYVTVRKLSGNTRSGGTVYAVTGVTRGTDKTSSDSYNKYDVTAYGTIYWRDNAFSHNDFLGASGGWDADYGASTGNRTAKLTGSSSASNYDTDSWSVGTSFDFDESDFDYSHTSFSMKTSADCYDEDGNEQGTIRFTVETSPFD